MKKAIIDQLFLGFLLLMGIVTFVATVNDETSTRNYIYDLKALTKASAKAMATYYADNIDMCTAQTITTDILNQQKLGTETLSEGLVSYKWWDSNGDGEPDQVTASIAAHPFDTFWYRFFDKDDFTVGPFSWTEPVDTPKSVTITYGGENAGFTNMVGLYQLDNNNCVVNPRIILANSDDNNLVGTLLNNGNAITSPPTRVFLISDGYNIFKNGSDRPTVNDTVTMNHCFSDVTDNTSNPTVTINGVTKNSANVYFEQNELNGDGYPHIQIIPESVWTTYNEYVGGYGAYNGQGTKTYDEFIDMCNIVNYDNNDYNNIPPITNDTTTSFKESVNDCIYDINNEYRYAMEDLNGGGDEDFNDIFLNTTRVVIPNQLNTYSVLDDGSINLTCNNNSAPSLELNCHNPNSTDENTSKTFDIINSVSDDNQVASITASALNGSVTLNTPSITYTPDTDFFGEDTISVIATDNEGASTTRTCTITVNEINLPPVISGTAQTSIEAGNIYNFIPNASDPDGDTLTFSISGKPSWASFDTSTGQIYGAPSNSNVGIYSNIIISVSDGTNSVSLAAFSIQVTEDTTNNAPVCSTIPAQSATETEAFSLNLDSYCTDSDGDDVNYELSSSLYSGSSSGLISLIIPDGTAGQITVNVTASDGIDTTSTSFILNIVANSECTINENEDFSSSGHGWSGGYRSGDSNKYYIIEKDDYGYKTYSFGNSCKNVNINISFEYATVNWESSDKLKFYRNDNYLTQYNRSNNNWKTETISTTTDSSGNIKISFKPDANKNNEYVALDNISISK